MELIITEKIYPSICLNMIVKDESHIIKIQLEKLCQKITFSYWVICDTGSTDNTCEIITEFFKSKNIPGELHKNPWVNFAHNRTIALQKAFEKSDLLLVFDADDEIVGQPVLPGVNDTIYDQYHLKFGSPLGTAYTRVLLVNNRKKFIYQSVIHEYICCVEPDQDPLSTVVIQGDYYVVSGRTGNRSLDPDKYLKDAKILAAAHAEAVLTNDPLLRRYAFYCANSYKDYGSNEEAIKWYKITLSQDNWAQEHYISCYHIYECYLKLNNLETGLFYLVKAFQYDQERVECLYPLLVHYCCQSQFQIAYAYYINVKLFFETQYLNSNLDHKLFIAIDKYNFYVPYYMILIADKVHDFGCVIKMFEIIFIKKMIIFDDFYIGNLLYNLQFFVQHVSAESMPQFIHLADEYIRFLHNLGIQLHKHSFLKEYATRFGLDVSCIFPELIMKETKKDIFSKEECSSSKNILFYTGFTEIEWNYSYLKTHPLGGSEKAVAYLSKEMGKDYNVYVTGTVVPESFDNVTYIKFQDISSLIKKIPFNTVICSRFIGFLEMFKECSFDKFYLWGHDTILIPHGCNLNDKQIITKWDKYITGCICQTEWHANLFKSLYPELTNKITIINNGLDKNMFLSEPINKKQTNKFIYSSRIERGLTKLLELWPQILEFLPDAELVIATYAADPDQKMMDVINTHDSIKYLGKLNTEQLYKEMKTSEYWLYPTEWPETSCITALEMLMTEVICVYYPVAGLVNTIKEHGIQVSPGNEIEKIINLTVKDKRELKINGKNYALTCSWENRAKEWSSHIFQEKNTVNVDVNGTVNVAIYNSFPFHYEMFGYIINYCKENQFSLTIFTNFENDLGWFEYYNSTFEKDGYKFKYKNYTQFENEKEQFDLIFVTTDDDKIFMSEWITDDTVNKKYICIDHTCYNRAPKFVNKLGVRSFINSDVKWAIPCFPALNIEDKIKLNTNECINIVIIGCYTQYNYDIVNRLYNDKNIILHIVGRYAHIFDVNNISNKKIECKIFSNLNTGELFELFKICDYLLTDVTITPDHITGVSMSGSIPLAFSSLCPLIISKQNNAIYNFKNVVEFDLETNDIININKNGINYDEFVEERKNLTSMLSSYIDELKNEIIYLRFFSDEGVNNTPEHWMSIEKLETLYNNKVILTNGDNYTHAIIINTCMPKLNIPKENVIGISHEPNIWLFMNKDKQLFIEYAQKHIDKYFVGDISDLPKPFIEGQIYFFYNKSNFYYEAKNKFCSFVISEKNDSFHDTLNYKYRHDLVKEILTTNLPIDIYGHGIKLYNDYNDPRIKHPLEWSLDNPFGTIPFEKYKFHICIENVNSNHYFSEKIINPLLSNVTPIYYGCKNIDNYFNNNNIIKLSGDTKKDIILLGQLFQDRDKDKDKEHFTDNYQSILNTTNIFNNLHKLFDNITLKNNDMKIFIIHYKKLHERKEFMINQFKRENIFNYEFITIDRDELTENDTKNFQQNMSKPLIANFLSHIYAYKQIETNVFDYNLILEDDAVLCSNFSNILQSYVNQISNDYDAVFIGNGANIIEHRIEASKIIENSNVYKYNGENKCKCTDSYFISKKGASHIINYFNTLKIKIDQPIDWFLNKPFKSSNVYWCEPPIVKQGTIIGLFNSSVGNGMLTYTGFNPNVLTCYKSPFKKIRVGKDFDGGYVICDIPNVNYDLLLGCGVDVDISFESQFCNKYKNALCYLYDGSVNDIYLDNKNMTFFKKYINNFNDENNTNLHEIIDKFNNIFLKMDIEGYEIPWIKSLSDEKLNKISQIVMEFHFPFEDYKKDVFEKLNKYFIMIHFHANNCCGVRNHNGIIIPNVFECTYLNRKFFNNNYELNTDIIPSALDMKNVYEHDEIYIDYEPFVNK